MREKALIATALAVLVTLSGCSALSGDGGSPSVEEIQTQAQQAMEGVSTYSFTLGMTMSANEQTLELSAEGVVDHENRRMRMQMDFMGQQLTQYVIGDTMYQNIGGMWQTQPVPEGQNMWESGTQLQQQRQIMEQSDVTLEGTQTMDGQEVYVISVDASSEAIRNVIEQQGGQTNLDQVSIENVEFTQYVRTSDYLPHRVEINMSVTSQGQTVDMDMVMTFSDFGQSVSIQLPPEAENAGSAAIPVAD